MLNIIAAIVIASWAVSGAQAMRGRMPGLPAALGAFLGSLALAVAQLT